MICLICFGFRIGVVSEDVAAPCAAVVAIVFRRVLPRSSVCSHPLGNSGSSIVGLGALSSVKPLSSSSPSDEKSTFPARRSMFFSVLVLILSVC